MAPPRSSPTSPAITPPDGSGDRSDPGRLPSVVHSRLAVPTDLANTATGGGHILFADYASDDARLWTVHTGASDNTAPTVANGTAHFTVLGANEVLAYQPEAPTSPTPSPADADLDTSVHDRTDPAATGLPAFMVAILATAVPVILAGAGLTAFGRSPTRKH
jgi:hypothetical protein